MSKISVLLKKSTAFALLLAVGIAAFSVSSVFAAGASPTTSTAASANTGLQTNWKYEVARYNSENSYLSRLDRVLDFDRSNRNFPTVREAQLSGNSARIMRDASLVLGQEIKIITAHAGFDASGNVSDQTKATQSVEQLGKLIDFYNGRLHFELRNIS